MKYIEKVTDLKRGMAPVEMDRRKACKTCGVCCMSMDAKKILTEALSLAHANIRDDMYVEFERKKVLAASFVLYGAFLLSGLGLLCWNFS